jgi:hypothetical protein
MAPYATIELESRLLTEPVRGFITHKLDFLHLWQAFEVRGVADDEEVIVIWNKSELKAGFRWFSRAMPGLRVWLCRQHSYELMNDPSFRPELSALERFKAAEVIEKWEPEALR